MAEFSGKILSAVYANEEYSIIKIRYDDGNNICVYYVSVDENNADFQELEAEGWTREKLIEETAEAKKSESRAFNIQVNEAAKALLEESGVQMEIASDKFIEYMEHSFQLILDDNDKDNLFKFKLWALESQVVKAASKEQKSRLRKAKGILEGFSILHEIKNVE
jgi:hypothetical protein